MKKSAVDPVLLRLLVSVYNQSIQTYFYFPDVIICGPHRMEREEFQQLLTMHFIQPYQADSFGRWYRLTRSGEDYLLQSLYRRKRASSTNALPVHQQRLPFFKNS